MLFAELAAIINTTLEEKGYKCGVSINTGNCNYTEVYRDHIWICHYTLDNESISIGKVRYRGKSIRKETIDCLIVDPNFVLSVIGNIERWWLEHLGGEP